MGYDYDALYAETPDALGAQTSEIADYFAGLTPPLRVLDIGCGQGRDALPLARAGFDVVGVDLSAAGVAQMLAAGAGLALTGEAADIRTYSPDGQFDVLLIDRTLHMLQPDEQRTVLARLLPHVAACGHVLIADERSNMDRFKAVIAADARAWQTTKDAKGYLFLQAKE